MFRMRIHGVLTPFEVKIIKMTMNYNIPTTGSKTACVACSSPIGVLNQIRFNLLAIGESSVEATIGNYHENIIQR